MATHSSILAWIIPGTEEPSGLPSMGSQSWTRLKQLSSSSSRETRIPHAEWCSQKKHKQTCFTQSQPLVRLPQWGTLASLFGSLKQALDRGLG